MKKRDYNKFDFKSVFELSDESPTGLTWKVPRLYSGKLNYSRVGEPAGFICRNKNRNISYYSVNVFRKHFLVHRIIMSILICDLDPNLDVDHIDGNGLNNSISNLRIVNPSVNSRNKRKIKSKKELACGVYLENYISKSGIPLSKIRAHYSENDKVISRSWSTLKRGYAVALDCALTWRKEQIIRLNELGAGYTERHGT